MDSRVLSILYRPCRVDILVSLYSEKLISNRLLFLVVLNININDVYIKKRNKLVKKKAGGMFFAFIKTQSSTCGEKCECFGEHFSDLPTNLEALCAFNLYFHLFICCMHIV